MEVPKLSDEMKKELDIRDDNTEKIEFIDISTKNIGDTL